MSNSAQVRVEGFDIEALTEDVRNYIDADLKAAAERVASAAVASTDFKDSPKMKNKLRKSIKPKVSKYPDGGWIVRATAPHAHLVEFGHAMVTTEGFTVGHVPAHPFLRNALQKVQIQMVAEFKTMFGGGE